MAYGPDGEMRYKAPRTDQTSPLPAFGDFPDGLTITIPVTASVRGGSGNNTLPPTPFCYAEGATAPIGNSRPLQAPILNARPSACSRPACAAASTAWRSQELALLDMVRGRCFTWRSSPSERPADPIQIGRTLHPRRRLRTEPHPRALRISGRVRRRRGSAPVIDLRGW